MNVNKDGLPLITTKTRRWFYENHSIGLNCAWNQFYHRFYYHFYIKKDVDFIQEVLKKQDELIKSEKVRLEKIVGLHGDKAVQKAAYDPFAS